MRLNIPSAMIGVLSFCALLPASSHAANDERADLEKAVTHTVRPIMEQYGIPGMAVGIVVNGQSHVYDFGVASQATKLPVTRDTLFEIGSVSKTLTATLASYAQASGHLSLSDSVSKYLPALRGTAFDKVSLLNLGTHTAGGFPLQVPRKVKNDAQLMAYFQSWKPTYAPGTYRTYANPSVGLLGVIAAKSMNGNFDALMDGKLFPGLGMKATYIDVPSAQMHNYAQGYTMTGAPIRMSHGVLASETYGVKTTADDMARFLEFNMGMLDLDETLRRATIATHTGYYRVGAMTQDLIWEQYRYPVALKELLEGNSAKMSAQSNPVVEVDPPSRPAEDVLLNKTGSTNGFAAYVAFVPGRKIGVILLANKTYPIDARVTAAHDILTSLASQISRTEGCGAPQPSIRALSLSHSAFLAV